MEIQNSENIVIRTPKPSWLRVKLPHGENYLQVKQTVDDFKLHTICQSGHCPNMGECWGAGTATFMILGDICTRSCGFCAVATGKPENVDVFEPLRVAKAVKLMSLKHCVITSVNRDELADCGMKIWTDTVKEIRKLSPETTIETLIPDVKGNWSAMQALVNEKPEVISHNLETVKRLYRTVRPQAEYNRSLEQLVKLKESDIRTKSGIMLGLGERDDEILETMDDLAKCKLDVLTLGQYLQPSNEHLAVQDFILPEKFAWLEEEGYKRGFDYVESGPLVRSSYHSEKHVFGKKKKD